jgi:hypothetical protein
VHFTLKKKKENFQYLNLNSKSFKILYLYLPNRKLIVPACSFGLSATSQQYFSLRTNQPPATSRNKPAVLFSQNKPAPAISHKPTEQADCSSRLASRFVIHPAT